MKRTIGYILSFFGGILFSFVLLVCLLIFFEADIVSDKDIINQNIVSPEYNVSQEKLWNIVQEWRKNNNQNVYIENEVVCKIADERLIETKKEWSHRKFLEDRDERYAKYPQYITFGENLAKGYSDEEEILKGWINSPTHLENLEKDYKYSCIRTDGNYVVHIFGNVE